ncbi:MAG: hypothetical protein HQL67_12340 [Magnetococcales bacterium]|nr:hypothetical protein [Magnetococcales bacterium]
MKGKLSPDGKIIIYKIPMHFKRRGSRRMVVLPEHEAARKQSDGPSGDPMVNALVKAWRWQRMLDKGKAATIRQLAEIEKVDHSFMARTLRLNDLAPDIVEAILDGKIPDTFNLKTLRGNFPLAWSEQRESWGCSQ